MVEALQAATRVLAGVALRSLDGLDGAVTLPQFRVLAVLADLGRARSGRVARALGLQASTVTRLADRLVASGHLTRGGDPRHRGVVTLALTRDGRDMVNQVQEGAAASCRGSWASLAPADREAAARTLRQLVAAASEGYGRVPHRLVLL